jgi:hypothetical protein
MILELAKNDGVDITNRDGLREYNEKRNREGKSLIQEIDRQYNSEENKDKTFIFESVRRLSEIRQLREIFKENFILVGINHFIVDLLSGLSGHCVSWGRRYFEDESFPGRSIR